MTRKQVWMTALALTTVMTVGACGKKAAPPLPATTAATAGSTGTTPTTAPATDSGCTAPAPATLTEDQIFAQKSLEQVNAERPLGDVFFDLDESTIRDDARALLQRNADWMKRWASTAITVEGHCDSRGSSEYNLALGTRRANAVKDYLASLGVSAGRVTVISKGKEQPFCTTDEESCWQQNRRGHFIVTAK